LAGIYSYNGTSQPQLLSRDIDPLIRRIRQLDAQVAQWVVDIQADWQRGTVNDNSRTWDTVTVPGSVIMSSETFVDTSSTQFAMGTLTNVSTDTVDSLRLTVSTRLVNQGDFETSDTWTCGTSGSGTCTIGAVGTINATTAVRLNDPSGCGDFYLRVNKGESQEAWANNTISQGSSGQFSFDFISQIGVLSTSSVRLCFQSTFPGSDPGCGNNGSLANIYSSTVPIGFTLLFDFINQCSGSTRVLYIDNVKMSSYVPSGTFTSRSFDTQVTTPTISPFVLNFSSNAQAAVTWQEQDSADGSSWGTAASLSPNASPASKRRYWRYQGNFTTTSGTMTARLEDVGTMTAIGTGTYRSEVHFVGTAISAWKQFNVTETNPTGIAYHVRASTNIFTVNSSTPVWSYQINNQTVDIATGSYFQFEIDSTSVTVATQGYVAARAAVNWQEGTAAPVASGYLDHRYYLCATVSSTSLVNDACLVLQKNNRWTTWTGPNIGAMASFDNDLVVGSADTDSRVWKIMQDGVYQDDGEAINAFWTTKDFTFGTPFQEDIVHEVWIDAAYVSSSTITMGYAANRGSSFSNKSIDLDDVADYVNERVSLDKGYVQGRYFKLKFSNSTLDERFKINAFQIFSENKARTVP
jgi:hypothetical protein